MSDSVLAKTCSKGSLPNSRRSIRMIAVFSYIPHLEVTRDTEVATGISLGSQAITVFVVLRLLGGGLKGRDTSEHGAEKGLTRHESKRIPILRVLGNA